MVNNNTNSVYAAESKSVIVMTLMNDIKYNVIIHIILSLNFHELWKNNWQFLYLMHCKKRWVYAALLLA